METRAQEFIVSTRSQREWRWLIAIGLFLAGIGSGAFVVAAFVTHDRLDSLVGLLVGVIGPSAAFFFDLNRKSQFWRVMLRPRTSWISRGILLIMLFLVFGLLYLLSSVNFLLWAASISALGVMMYSGFLLSYSPAIPFWNTPLLPLISLAYSLMGGVALLMTLGVSGSAVDVLGALEIGLIVICALLILTYLVTMSSSTVASREAAAHLVYGRMAGAFWGLVVAVGLFAPLGLAYYVLSTGQSPVIIGVAGLLELAGGLSFRYCLLRSGIRLAVA